MRGTLIVYIVIIESCALLVEVQQIVSSLVDRGPNCSHTQEFSFNPRPERRERPVVLMLLMSMLMIGWLVIKSMAG